MLLETEKQKVCINQIVGQNVKEVEVEEDVIVNDIKPDVLNIINTDGIVCVYKKEVIDGALKIDGSINVYIMYLADDDTGTIRSLNTVLDFKQVVDIDRCMLGMTARVNVDIKNIECKVLNGRKINVKATVSINAEVYSNDDVEMIANVENLEDVQVLNDKEEVNSLIGTGNTTVYAKNTISVDTTDELAEIMKANVRVINKDIKLSYNKVLVKADADISLLYLTEDNRINNVSTRIPVMGFVDIENVNDDTICDVDYQIKNIVIKPNNADVNSIYVEVEIEINCSAYETKELNLIKDLYSVSSNLSFLPKEIIAMSDKQELKETCSIKEQINIAEINSNKIYNAKVNTNLLTTTVRNGKIVYEGEISLELLFETNNGLNTKNVNIPFNFEMTSNKIDESFNVKTNIDVSREDFIINADKIDTNIELEFSVDVFKNQKLDIINEVEMEEAKDNNIYSMVIYFVKPEDTIWGIAKEFRSTVDDIIRLNDIEDKNEIHVGQQLYIPKFIKRTVMA